MVLLKLEVFAGLMCILRTYPHPFAKYSELTTDRSGVNRKTKDNASKENQAFKLLTIGTGKRILQIIK